MSAQRIDNLTGLRGYAAMWVVLYHAAILYRGDRPVSGLITQGFYGVDVFFVLSGFVLSLVYVPRLPARFSLAWYKPFLLKRFAKIYPMHLLAFAAIFALLSWAGYHHPDATTGLDNSAWPALFQALMLQSFGVAAHLSWNAASWSVSAEWFAYTVLFAPMVFGLRRLPLASVAVLAAAAWAGFVTLCLGVLHRNIGVTDIGAVRIAPEFLAGYLLFRLVSLRTPRYGDALTASGLALIAGTCLLPGWSVLLLAPALLLLLAGLYAGGPFSDKVFGNAACIRVGEASYSMYLLQQLVFIAVDQVAKRRPGGEGLLLSWPWVLAVLLLAYAAGRLAFLYIEEPLRIRILGRFGAERRDPEASKAAPPPGLHADTDTAATIS